jgi:ABC-type transport system involved in cytochrome c biogenesis permease subunit
MTIRTTLILAAALAGLAPAAFAQEPVDIARAEPLVQPPAWSDDIIATAQAIPVQDAGRVKPLETVARFRLLRFAGKRTLTLEVPGPGGATEEVRRQPVEWLLDTLFYPEVARHYPLFIVDDAALLEAIGLEPHPGERRDRYSFAYLQEGRDELISLAQEYAQREARDRTPLQNHMVRLAGNLHQFEMLLHYFDFGRWEAPEGNWDALMLLTGSDGPPSFAQVLARGHVLTLALVYLEEGVEGIERLMGPEQAGDLATMLPEGLADLPEARRQAALQDLNRLLRSAHSTGTLASALALIPPAADSGAEEWMTIAEVTQHSLVHGPPSPEALDLIAALERLPELRGEAAFDAMLTEFAGVAVDMAEARGEYGPVPLEVAFYNARFFFYAQWLFVVCFLLVAVLWFVPRAKWLARGVMVALLAPTTLLIIGITMRCIIRGRPPVTTLYETILFVTAVGIIVALITELMSRRRIALSLAPVLGALGMFLAHRYEAKEGVDTMPALIAVLDTNFWLSTHVTTVTIGYSAGLLAAAIAHIYIVGRLLGFKRGDKDFYTHLTRMNYGTICFALVFSTVGTVLGGIWANESWGRFWGWDPKENGALMIVLWSLFIVHARMGGYIRKLGINVSAIILGMIVAFSWWGVNLMGVGLHSYGWTSGIYTALLTFYAIELVVLFLAWVVWFRELMAGAKARERKPAEQRPARADESGE